MEKSNNFLFKAYTIIVIFTALLTFSSIFILEGSLKELKNDGRIINLAGRQRMLSQAIVKELLFTQLNNSDGNTKADIVGTINSFVSAQHDLLTGNNKVGLSKMDAESIKKFHQVDFCFNAFIHSLSINFKNKIPFSRIMKVMDSQKQFLVSMDNFVFFLDTRNKQKITFFETKMILIFCSSFVILLTQIFFVFIPGFKKIAAQKTRLYIMSFRVSHLLRKPVANVLGALSIIDDSNFSASNRNIVNIIKNEAIEIDHIIREQSINIEEEHWKI